MVTPVLAVAAGTAAVHLFRSPRPQAICAMVDDGVLRWERLTRLFDAAGAVEPDPTRVSADTTSAGGRRSFGGFLDSPALALAAPLLTEGASDRLQATEGEPVGARMPIEGGTLIGPYRLLREVARGGMGAVYLAERADGQFEQRVALKLIKLGMDSDEIHRRFLAERQFLARLNHPHIARLYDGGVSLDGRPYFVMEYVDGLPLTDYCDTHRLEIDRRLRLFSDVCGAVRHAHQHLIIHRDLKPSNIMVTVDGQVKLLDFGIAKLVEQEADAAPALTEAGLRVMTPEYAAPEQVRGEPVTTATDVYALGTVLYELLTGHRAHRLQRGTLLEVEQVVCEAVPTAPSAVVARAEEISRGGGKRQAITPATVSLARGTEPLKLRRQLSGDLDTIVLKALQKIPARRYASADALLSDLQRYSAGLPVQARPDSGLYRSGKFIRRHRVGVGATAGLFLALLAGLVGTTWQARVASQEAAKATEVKNFVKDLFNVATPAESRGREITAREILERGTRQVDSALARQPEVQLELLDFLGQVHRDLGYYDRADSLLRRAIIMARRQHGSGSLAEATELATWGTVLYELGDYARAESVLTAALATRQRLAAADDTVIAVNLNDLAVVQMWRGEFARAEPLLREAVAISRKRHGGAHLTLAHYLDNLGGLMWRMDRLPEADSLIRAGLTMRRRLLDPGHPLVVISLHDLAVITLAEGRLEEAERLEREALAGDRKLYPAGHPELAIKLQQLSQILDARGRYAEADSALVEALAIRRKWFGPEHPSTMETLANLGVHRYVVGDLPAAEAAMRDGLAFYTKTLGPEHPATVTILHNLGGILTDEGKYAEAEAILRRSLAVRRRVLGDSTPDVGRTMRKLGVLFQREGRLAEADSLLRQALALVRRGLPAGHPSIAEALSSLGGVLVDRGRPAEAEPLLREALAIRTAKHGAADPRTLETRSLLGACLADLGRAREAEPLLFESYQALRASPYGRTELPGAGRRLARYYEAHGRAREAAAIRRNGPRE